MRPPVAAAPALTPPLSGASQVALAGKSMAGFSLVAFGAAFVIGFEDALTALAAALAVALLSFVRAPALGLLALVWLAVLDVPFRVYVLPAYDLPYNTLNYVLLAVGVFTLPTITQTRDAATKWLLALIVCAMLQLLTTSNPELGMVTVLELIAGAALIGAFLRWGADDIVLYWAAVVAATTSMACLLAYLVLRPETAVNDNALAQMPLAALVAVALAASRKGAVANWPLVGLLTTANIVLLFFTESRGTFVLGVVLGMFIVLRSPGVLQKVLAIAACAGLFVWGTIAFDAAAGTTTEKWARLMDPDVSFSQASNRRIDLAEVGWIIFKENPLGTGTGSFSDFEDYTLGDNLPHRRRAAHSAWVKTMAENGVPGLILLGGFVLSFVFARNRDDRRLSAALGPLTAIILALGFLTVEFQSKALWLFAGGTLALLHSAVLVGRIAGYRTSVLKRPSAPNRKQP